MYFLKVFFMLSGHQQIVKVLLLLGLFEWEDSLNDNEDYDSDGEQVNLSAVVSLSHLDLRGHVGHRASVAFQLVDGLVASEAKICYFQVQIVVNENVFKLQIAMYTSQFMHVLDSVQKLEHHEATGVLAHACHALAEVEEETTLDILHHDEHQVIDNATGGFYDLTRVAEVKHSYDTHVIQVLEDRNFVLDRKDRILVSSEEFFLQDLDSDQLGGIVDVSTQVDL